MPDSNQSYGWHFQYLTIVGLSLTTITFIVGLFADLTLSRHLFTFKNALSVTSAPMEILITLLYWGLRSVCLCSLLSCATFMADCSRSTQVSFRHLIFRPFP